MKEFLWKMLVFMLDQVLPVVIVIGAFTGLVVSCSMAAGSMQHRQQPYSWDR